MCFPDTSCILERVEYNFALSGFYALPFVTARREVLLLYVWLLTAESAALTLYVIISEIRLARLETVPVNWAINLVFMWTFTLMSWALVIAAWNPLQM